MPNRFEEPFTALPTTAPSFIMGASNVFTSTAAAIESTSVREFQGPGSRVVHVVSVPAANGADTGFFVNFATASTLASASSTGSFFVPAGVPAILSLRPITTHMAIKSLSTTTGVKVNVTPGYGHL